MRRYKMRKVPCSAAINLLPPSTTNVEKSIGTLTSPSTCFSPDLLYYVCYRLFNYFFCLSHSFSDRLFVVIHKWCKKRDPLAIGYVSDDIFACSCTRRHWLPVVIVKGGGMEEFAVVIGELLCCFCVFLRSSDVKNSQAIGVIEATPTGRTEVMHSDE